jgi:mxaJ protein
MSSMFPVHMARRRMRRARLALGGLLAALVAALTLCAAVSRARAAESPNAGAPAARELRVCSDPNNMPFSNERREGFENALAELLARDLGAELSYLWWPQRRGFLKRTLNAHLCDVVMGMPAHFERVLTTQPVYRSTYVFVARASAPPVRSLDATELRSLRIGVPLVGDDGANPSPVTALIQRQLIENLRGYMVYGDYREESPPSALIRAVSRGDVDIAIAWGPLAGYYAHRASPPLRVTPIPSSEAPAGMPFTFDIALAVRKDDAALQADLDAALQQRRPEIRKLLARFDFPTL